MSVAAFDERGTSRFRVGVLARFVARDLRGGLRGARVFVAALAIGVFATTCVIAVSDALTRGLARDGRTLLGGDISVSRSQRPVTDDERKTLSALGPVSGVLLMRGMASGPGGDTALVEIKAPDAAYPLVGEIKLEPAQSIQSALAERDGLFGAVADEALMARLGIKAGDRLKLGTTSLDVRAIISSEPDRVASGIGFGPRLMVSPQALQFAGLLQPTSVTRWSYRVILGNNAVVAPDAAVDATATKLGADLREAGWETRSRAAVSPQLTRNIERLSQFLALVGLISLLVAGVGVANSVRGFVERKRDQIATLKALGASGSFVFAAVLAQMLCVALIGVALGMIAGLAVPFALAPFVEKLSGIPFAAVLSGRAAFVGMLFGALATLAFAVGPAGTAHDVPVATLFRQAFIAPDQPARWRYRVMSAAAFLALFAAVIAFASDRILAAWLLIGTLGAFGLLRLMAAAIVFIARRAPRVRNIGLRLAIANIGRPGAVTASVVASLGLGLALLVTLTSVDYNLRKQLRDGQPGRTPDFFFVDVQSAQADGFRAFLQKQAVDGRIEDVPLLRGRIIKLNEVPADKAKAADSASWVLEGDRGITYAANIPAGSSIVKGAWWPADYKGPPLVSMDQEIAQGLNLDIGDRVTVNVSGRAIEAKIANLRKVDWRSFGINFVLVFSPSTFAGAPFSELFTLSLPPGHPVSEQAAIIRQTALNYPGITAVRVREALDAIGELVGKLANAIRGVSAIALCTALLVLAGAVAAGQRARIYDAVVLQTLGATRARILGATMIEFALLGSLTALFAVVAGAGASAIVVERLMRFDFAFDWSGMALTAVAGTMATVMFGLVTTWRILGQKPARTLRDL